jgi:hypothetical protein
LAHCQEVCFIDRSLAHKRNVIAAPVSSKRQLGRCLGQKNPELVTISEAELGSKAHHRNDLKMPVGSASGRVSHEAESGIVVTPLEHPSKQ